MEGLPDLSLWRKDELSAMGWRRFWRRVSLRRGPVGEPGEGVRLQGTAGDSGRRTPEMEHLSMGALLGRSGGGELLCWGHWRLCKKALETGISFHRGPAGEPRMGARLPGTLREMDERGSRGGVSLSLSLWRGSEDRALLEECVLNLQLMIHTEKILQQCTTQL